MSVERRAQCPTCGRPVRLTEAELIDKRGFCAVCDARFDILPEILVGDGPLREMAMTPVAPAALAEGPPLTRIKTSSTAPGQREVVWTPSRAKLAALVPFSIAWWSFLVFWFSMTGDAPILFRIFPIFHVAAGVYMIWLCYWSLAGRERVVIGPGQLFWERGAGPFVKQRQLRLVDVTEVRGIERTSESRHGHRTRVRTSHGLHIGVVGQPPIELGKNMDFESDHIEWLRAHIAASVTEARRLPH